jgi:hypothetical protein
VKITQVSPTRLICEDDKFWTSYILFIVIGSLGAACYVYGTYTANPSFKIGLYAFLTGALVCLFSSQYTTTFDLERKSMQRKRHWMIFRGDQCDEHPISSIKNIEVYRMRIHYYHPAVRLRNGKMLRMTGNPRSEDESSVAVTRIQRFLGLQPQ